MKHKKLFSRVVGTTLSLILAGSLTIATPSVFASTSTASVKAHHIIAHAERIQNRVQYHWGAYNPSKMWFDCSSFTKYLYKQEGIQLRWGARKQYTDGKKISKSQLRPGDLVFFSTPGTVHYSSKYKKIGHVGIYIGNGRVIHDVDPKLDVIISNINRGWWKNHYMAAARVLPYSSSTGAAISSGAGVVVRSVSFLRSPSLHGSRIRYLAKGEHFTVLSKVNKYWYKIRDKNGRVGYVTTWSKYVRASASTTGRVVRSVSFLRSPSLHGSRIRYLAKGEHFTVLSKVNKYWYKIRDKNGRVGYVTTWSKYVSA